VAAARASAEPAGRDHGPLAGRVRGPDADLALAGRCAASANPAVSRAAAGQEPVVRDHLPDGDTLADQATG
jgi:hypothetical protein